MAKTAAQKPDDDETRPKKPKVGASIAVWILVIMLIAGLGGFGITNFGGGLRSVGSVGGRDISVQDYANAVQTEARNFGAQFGQNLTMEQIRALGLDRRALAGLIDQAALDNEADMIGLSVGDARVAEQLAAAPGLQTADGGFDRAQYTDLLRQLGLSAEDFEANLRRDQARSLLQGALAGGFVAPTGHVDALYAWLAERRALAWLPLSESDLPAPLPAATEEDLTAWHETNIATYTRPEARRIRYAALLPAEKAAGMAVDEADLKAAYDARIDEFVVPEKRLVERLVYPDQAAADKAGADLAAGQSFDDLVAARGVNLTDIDLGDVSEAELGAAGAEVFALADPGVVGPVTTDLGPAIFRVNGILPAQNVTLEDARADLSVELQTEAARDDIAGRIDALDDLIAGGATLDDVAREAGVEVRSVDLLSEGQTEDPIAGYAEFREAAAAADIGEMSDGVLLDDGGLVVFEVAEVLPPAPLPLTDVRDRVEADWRQAELTKALTARAEAIRAELEAGASLSTFGITDVALSVARNGPPAGDIPPEAVAAAFDLAAGDSAVVSAPEGPGLVQVTKVTPAPAEGAEAEALRGQIGARAEAAIAADAMNAIADALAAEAGLTIDQQAIEAVLSQSP